MMTEREEGGGGGEKPKDMKGNTSCKGDCPFLYEKKRSHTNLERSKMLQDMGNLGGSGKYGEMNSVFSFQKVT